MLLPLTVFSFVLIQLPFNDAAFNGSEQGRQARSADFYRREPSLLFLPNLNPFKPYWMNRASYDDNGEGEIPNGGEGRSWIFNRFRPSNKNGNSGSDKDEDGPSSRIINRLSAVSGNSNGNTLLSSIRRINPLATYAPCTSTNGEEEGICLPSPVCAFYGGRSTGGNCRLATSCCVNEVTKCGALVTINNTYWQSPASVSSESTCGLTIKLGEYLMEQRLRTCQIRLDFISFSIAQPNAETVCQIDAFQVAGATNKIPVICGDNDGQHMYLSIPEDATSVQLIMAFGSSTVARSWRIKIALLPCNQDYLAPDECLQYFTTPIGTVNTFNWKDSSSRLTRQLANQDYYICFRTELVNKQSSTQIATTLCLTECQVTTGIPFSLSGSEANTPQTSDPASCSNDYVVLPGGFSLPATTPINQRDRFCGTMFSQMTAQATAQDPAPVSQSICSTAKPFRLLYRTNGDETKTDATDTDPAIGNQGFCLSFEQKLS